MKMSLLLREPPLQILPSLAVAIGLNESIVLQQLYYLLQGDKNGKILGDGEKYIFNTYEGWQKYFPFFSEPTIKRIFTSLEERGLVISCQPEGGISRRKYYRIGEGALSQLTYERLDEQTNSSDDEIKVIPSGTDQNDPIDGSNCALPLTETTAKTTTETIAPSAGRDETVRHEPKKPRPRNELLEAVAKIETRDLSEIADWGRHAAALKKIKAVAPNVTEAEINRRVANYKHKFPKTSVVTSMAIANNWHMIGSAHSNGERPSRPENIPEFLNRTA